MAISTLWRETSRFDRSLPTVSLGVKHAQVIMILLPIVAAKNVQFVLEQSRRVIFYLRGLDHRPIIVLLVSLNALVLRPESVDEAPKASLARLLVILALAHQDPLQLLGHLLPSHRKVVWRIVRVSLVGHAHVLDTLLLLVIIRMRKHIHSIVDHSLVLLLLLIGHGRNYLATHIRHLRD
jgi:hypothetical protein